VLVARWPRKLHVVYTRRHCPVPSCSRAMECRQRSQSGTGISSGQDPTFRQKQGTGYAGIHWNRRAAGLALAHSLPPRCERPSTGPRRARTGRNASASPGCSWRVRFWSRSSSRHFTGRVPPPERDRLDPVLACYADLASGFTGNRGHLARNRHNEEVGLIARAGQRP
jgi:hypothetical protein